MSHPDAALQGALYDSNITMSEHFRFVTSWWSLPRFRPRRALTSLRDEVSDGGALFEQLALRCLHAAPDGIRYRQTLHYAHVALGDRHREGVDDALRYAVMPLARYAHADPVARRRPQRPA